MRRALQHYQPLIASELLQRISSVVNLHNVVLPDSSVLVTVTDLMAALCEGPKLKLDLSVRPFAGTAVVAVQTLLAAEPGLPVVTVAGLPNTIPAFPAPGTVERVMAPFASVGLSFAHVDAVTTLSAYVPFGMSTVAGSGCIRQRHRRADGDTADLFASRLRRMAER